MNTKYRNHIIFTCFISVVFLMCSDISRTIAQHHTSPRKQNQEGQKGPKVSLDLDNVTLKQALQYIFQQAKRTYRIAPDVAPSSLQQTVSLHVKLISLHVALKELLAGGMPYRIDKGVYLFETPKVSVEIENEDPVEALESLVGDLQAQGIHADYAFCREFIGTQKISLSCHDVSPAEAVRRLVARMKPPHPLHLLRIGTIYVLQPDVTWQNGQKLWPWTLDTCFVGANRRDAIKAVLSCVGASYMLRTPALNRVTQENIEIAFRSELDGLLRESDPLLNYRVAEGTFIVTPRHWIPQTPTGDRAQ